MSLEPYNKVGRTTKRRDPNLPKKPHNCFVLYRMDKRREFIKHYNDYASNHKGEPNKRIQQKAFAHASALLASMWQSESMEVKQRYKDMSMKKLDLYNLEKAMKARAALEKEMQKQEEEEEEEEGFADTQCQDTPVYCAPTFVEEKSRQTDHVSPRFQHSEAPNSIQAPINSALNWTFNPIPSTQLPMPMEIHSRVAQYPQYLQQVSKIVPVHQDTAPNFQTSCNLAPDPQALNDYLRLQQSCWNQPIQQRYLGAHTVPASFLAPQPFDNNGQASHTHDGQPNPNIQGFNINVQAPAYSTPVFNNSEVTPENYQITPNFQTTLDDAPNILTPSFDDYSRLPSAAQFITGNLNQGMEGWGDVQTAEWSGNYTQPDGENFISNQLIFHNGLPHYEADSVQANPRPLLNSDTSGTSSLEKITSFRGGFDPYGRYITSIW